MTQNLNKKFSESHVLHRVYTVLRHQTQENAVRIAYTSPIPAGHWYKKEKGRIGKRLFRL